jgi:hypothetical protein
VLSDDHAIEDDAHGVVVGAQVDRLAHDAATVQGVRHRVGVGVEVHAGLLRHDHGHDEIGVEGVLWQGA